MGIINVYSYKFPEPLGSIGIAESDGRIMRVIFNCTPEALMRDDMYRYFSIGAYACNDIETADTPVLNRAAEQIEEFLSGSRAVFDLPVSYSENNNKPFYMKVLHELQNIPAGRTRSYKEIASDCGNEKAARAVGLACNKNPVPVIIPCHRVVGGKGRLLGYAGGLDIKQYLLDLEKKYYV